MTVEQSFLAAIDTGDATLRLVYADWLTEQGREDEAQRWRMVADKEPRYRTELVVGPGWCWYADWASTRGDFGCASILPDGVYRRLPDDDDGDTPKFFVVSRWNTRLAALQAAAIAFQRSREEVNR